MLNFNLRKPFKNDFITSQFSYAPVERMFQNRKLNHHIIHIHETELEVLYKDNKSTFDKLHEKDDSSMFLERKLQKLVTEIFEVKMNLASKFMKDVLKIPNWQHCVRNDLKSKLRKIHLVRYGIETTFFIGATFWNSLLSDTKECKFLELFKSKILENCPSKLYKNYFRHIGYVSIMH